MDPILRDIPEQIETERLIIRVPRAGDGQAIYEAVKESHDRLKPWFPWAKNVLTLEEYEVLVRTKQGEFQLKKDIMLFIFLKENGKMIGSTGLHPRDWSVPKFEIGYWIRSGYEGKGYVIETVNGLTKFAFETVGAKRVLIRCDARNERSRSVAERAGYTYEGTFRNFERCHDDESQMTDMLYFSMIDSDYKK